VKCSYELQQQRSFSHFFILKAVLLLVLLDSARPEIETALRSFLAEDLGFGDITTNALVKPGTLATADVVCNEHAVVAGLVESLALLELVGCAGKPNVQDGGRVSGGTRLLGINGPGRSLLIVERTMLNLLSHMSGVATATAELVAIVKQANAHARVACTRKTLPGLRYFEKKAVELGGGDTHRLRLDDAVLIKDNHLSLSGSISDSVKTARSKVSFTKKIEAEVTEPAQAVEAALAGADIILLDNMEPGDVRKTVSLLERKNLRLRILLEASGRISKQNIADYARTGVDVVSIGSITHSARSIDVSMDVKAATSKRRASS